MKANYYEDEQFCFYEIKENGTCTYHLHFLTTGSQMAINPDK